jgi:hypothetical protein
VAVDDGQAGRRDFNPAGNLSTKDRLVGERCLEGQLEVVQQLQRPHPGFERARLGANQGGPPADRRHVPVYSSGA